MSRKLTIIAPDTHKDSARSVVRLAEFMGIEQLQILKEWTDLAAQVFVSGKKVCIVAKASELVEPVLNLDEIEQLRKFLMNGAHAIFLYGFSGATEEISRLKHLTNGYVESCKQLSEVPRTYRMNFKCRQSGQRFEGIEYNADERTQAVTFDLSERRKEAEVLLTAGGNPYFVKISLNESTVYLAGCNEIADINISVPKDVPRMTYFSTVVPLIIFLREMFGDECWHNHSAKACFIIDDPMLSMNYGFINYEALLSVIQQQKMCASVAFIPWNYKRTGKDVARLFRSNPEYYSLTIHGYDHTWGEFGENNESVLKQKSIKADERMALHRQLTGIPYDNVMVFPQGIFSAPAMKALKSSGYLAAVNSTPYSVDPEENSITLAELLDVAVMRYSNFPLLVRRYPWDYAETAFDLYLGRPVLLTEHHTYFRDGYGQLADLAGRIQSFGEHLNWKSIAEICSHACMMRTTKSGDIHVKYYTDQFRIRNNSDKPQNYVLSRTAYAESASSIKVNGQPVAFEQDVGTINVRLSLNAGETAEIRVDSGLSNNGQSCYRESSFKSGRVYIRRHLSEFRDNYIAKSILLSRLWKAIRNLF